MKDCSMNCVAGFLRALPKIQGHILSEVAEALQAATRTHTMLVDPQTNKETSKHSKINTRCKNTHKEHATKFQVCFSGVA